MKFDKMVESGNYSCHDSFISIGYTFRINDIEFRSDPPLSQNLADFSESSSMMYSGIFRTPRLLI